MRCPSRGNRQSTRQKHNKAEFFHEKGGKPPTHPPKTDIMISSNSRATRSRYSSPAQPHNSTWNGVLDASKGPSDQGSRALMKRWLEPSVQSKASFEDDGLVRYGVVENMAPLGTMPKAKKPGLETTGTTTTVRKIILRPSGASAAKTVSDPLPSDPATSTVADVVSNDDTKVNADTEMEDAGADGAAVASTRAVASSPPPTTQPPTPPRRRSVAVKEVAAVDDEGDEDYDPKGAPKRRQSTRASLGRRTRRSSGPRRSSIVLTKSAAKEVKEVKESKKFEKETEKEPMGIEPTNPSKEKEESDSVEPGDKEFIDKVVEAAVDEALKHYRYPTAWALRTLYDEKAGDARFVAMLEDVFGQTADADTLRKFSKLMERKKREGKKDNQGCYYFIPPTTNSRFTPHKPKAAPYGKLLHGRHQEEQEQEQKQEEEDQEREQEQEQEQEQEHEQDQEQEQEQQDPEMDLDEKHRHHHPSASEGRATKRAKTSHSRSRSQSGSHAQAQAQVQAQAQGRHQSGSHATRNTSRKMASGGEPRTPSRKRARKDSASSDSSLSSALSLSSPDASVASVSPGHRGGTTGTTTTATAAAAAGSSSSDAPKPRPINIRRKSLPSKPKQPRTSQSAYKSPTQTHTHTQPVSSTTKTPSNQSAADASASATISVSAKASMPGRVPAAQLFPNLPPKPKTAKGAAKASSVPVDEDCIKDEDCGFWDRRRDAQKFASSVAATESSIRDGDDEEQVATPAKRTRRTRQSIVPPTTTRATRSASKRPHDEVDSAISPVAWNFPGDNSSTVGSRAVTPTLRPPKKQRSGLRVKSS